MDISNVAILIGAGALIGLLLFLFLWFMRHCKKSKNYLLIDSDGDDATRTYSSMNYENQDIGLVDYVRQEKESKVVESREAAFVYLQFYLRSNPHQNYELVKHLPCIGNKIEKNWFLLKHSEFNPKSFKQVSKQKLLVLLKHQTNSKKMLFKTKKSSSIIVNVQQVKLLNELLVSLKHPFVLSYDEVNISFEQNYTLFVSNYAKDGSLKDLIYNSNPIKAYNEKYQYKSNGLPVRKLREFTKQIVQALIYLKYKMIPPIVDLHSGNILLENDRQTCLVSGYENVFVEVKSKVASLFEKQLKKFSKYQFVPFKNMNHDDKLVDCYQNKYKLESILEIFAFGHVFYEMAAGCELSDTQPQPKDYARIKSMHGYQDSEDILRFLNFIFYNDYSTNNQLQKQGLYVPFIFQIESNQFLSPTKPNNTETSEFNNLIQSDAIKEFIEYVMRKKRDLSAKKGFNKKVSSKSSITKSESKQETSFVTPITPPILSSPPPLGNLPPPPPPPFSLAIESTTLSGERSALLGDICKGTKLKKTVTVDKSKLRF